MDDRRRKRQRALRAVQDISAQAAYVAEGVRAGDVDQEWVVAAAELGHPVAVALVGSQVRAFGDLGNLDNRVEVIEVFWKEPIIRYLFGEIPKFAELEKNRDIEEIVARLAELDDGDDPKALAEWVLGIYDNERSNLNLTSVTADLILLHTGHLTGLHDKNASPTNNHWLFNNMCGLRRSATGIGSVVNNHDSYQREFLILAEYAMGLR